MIRNCQIKVMAMLPISINIISNLL